MAKRNRTTQLPAPGEGTVRISVTFPVFTALQDGKAKEVLCKDQLTATPKQVEVYCPPINQTETYSGVSMMSVFHGYRPEGYPEMEYSRGKSLSITVAPIAEEMQPLEAEA
jgi:hypothetical protein